MKVKNMVTSLVYTKEPQGALPAMRRTQKIRYFVEITLILINFLIGGKWAHLSKLLEL